MILTLDEAFKCKTVLIAMHEDPTKEKLLLFLMNENKIHSYVELPVETARVLLATLSSAIDLVTVQGTIQ